MPRICPLVLLVLLCHVFNGCSSKMNTVPRAGANDSIITESPVEKMREDLTRLSAENSNLLKQQDMLNAENQRLNVDNKIELAKIRDENKLLVEKINSLIEDKKQLETENKILIKALSDQKDKKQGFEGTDSRDKRIIESPDKKGSEKPVAPQKDMDMKDPTIKQPLKIKVLSGDGNFDSARNMAAKLSKMGYEVKIFGHANRSNYFENTVFYTKNYEDEAKMLITKIGTKGTIEPLSWPSMYDLIVVTGINK